MKSSVDHKAIAKKLDYIAPEKGIDGSSYEERYPLTCQGQPIGLTEHGARLASIGSTHVIQILDWDPYKLKIEEDQVNAKDGFYDFVLPNRPGYKRLAYYF